MIQISTADMSSDQLWLPPEEMMGNKVPRSCRLPEIAPYPQLNACREGKLAFRDDGYNRVPALLT